jgi:very-short-patch-repair endonuclease
MERGEQFTGFIPSHLGTQAPDLDGFYRAKAPDADDARPRDRSGFQPIAISSVLESIAIAQEIDSLCESPIELDLAVALTKALRAIDDPTLSLGHQFLLNRFRYDLAIKREGRSRPLVLIECDGKEFHSTEDRIAADRTKDALAAKAGIFLWRFSGSQIYRELDACVYRVLKAMRLRGQISARDWDALEFVKIV